MIHAQGFDLAARIRGGLGPGAAGAFKTYIEPIANKVWADQRYEKQAPHESALIYRLYAATLLLERPPDGNIVKTVQTALPWLRKAVLLDDETHDRKELQDAVNFFEQMAAGKVAEVKMSTMLGHQFRVAMPGAKPGEIEKHVQSMVQLLTGLVTPSAGGSSPKDDFNYLARHKLGGASIGQVMEAMRITLQARFPDVNIGGQPYFVPLPNGNTLVQYKFDNGKKTLTYQWEVNQSKGLIVAKDDVTRELMTLQVPQSSSPR
jgi:hypothetical protein